MCLTDRYMKNLFPKADETLLLDVLASSDNNIHETSEKLENLGYMKKELGLKQPHVQFTEKEEEVVEEIKPKVFSEEDKIECGYLLSYFYSFFAVGCCIFGEKGIYRSLL